MKTGIVETTESLQAKLQEENSLLTSTFEKKEAEIKEGIEITLENKLCVKNRASCCIAVSIDGHAPLL